jgi:uracil-DNA glycosylase family 4
MKPYGNFKKKILNIGEFPGDQDDRSGKPFQGKSGQLLQQMYKKLGVDLFEDCLNINACMCHPTGMPTPQILDNCRRNVLQVIQEYKPHIIVLFGQAPLVSVIGHRWKKNLGAISKWRGFVIPDHDFTMLRQPAWICPTLSPVMVERSKSGIEEVIWMQDLKQVVEHIDMPVPEYIEPEIEIITDLSVFDKITSGWITFDYETTGLKPHATGHRIICCSVADTANHVYVFMMPETRKERKPFVDLLLRKEVGKVAQNMKFEHTWSEVRLNVIVENWIWDTMLASHILDNRTGVTGLKFQSYIQFGIIDYSSEIQPYLEASDNDNANAINKIQTLTATESGRNKLMRYCGYDSIYERRLAELQMDFIWENELPF